MPSIVVRIIRYGISEGFSESKNRSIMLTNATAIALPLAFIIIMNVRLFTHPFDRVIVVGMLLSILYASIPGLNKAGYINLTRYLANMLLAYGILLLTILRKIDGTPLEGSYFVSRASILVFSVAIPFTLFHCRERQGLVISMLIWISALFLYDPIHNLAGVGYFQTGHTMKDYYYYNFFFLIIFLTYAFIVGYLKKVMEDYELRYEQSIRVLDEKNTLIQKQKEKLADKNWLLTDMLNKQDQNLIEINHELVQKNNDLVQFSLAVSHNLRSPVASILGLINLLVKQEQAEVQETKLVLDHLSRSAQQLDSVTHDLNRIMDERNDAFGPLIDINLEEELNILENSLRSVIEKYHVFIHYDLQVKILLTVRAYIHNIFHQLIINSIQFRSPDRQPYIKISSYQVDNRIVLEVADNGLGIDLTTQKKDLFKPFKQFHPAISGRGIGLYLVKIQVKKMNGDIHMASMPGAGSKVSIQFLA